MPEFERPSRRQRPEEAAGNGFPAGQPKSPGEQVLDGELKAITAHWRGFDDLSPLLVPLLQY